MRLFEQDGYAAFERVLAEGCQRMPMRILAYCLMPNHWHLLLWPATDGAVSRFMGWVTLDKRLNEPGTTEEAWLRAA